MDNKKLKPLAPPSPSHIGSMLGRINNTKAYWLSVITQNEHSDKFCYAVNKYDQLSAGDRAAIQAKKINPFNINKIPKIVRRSASLIMKAYPGIKFMPVDVHSAEHLGASDTAYSDVMNVVWGHVSNNKSFDRLRKQACRKMLSGGISFMQTLVEYDTDTQCNVIKWRLLDKTTGVMLDPESKASAYKEAKWGLLEERVVTATLKNYPGVQKEQYDILMAARSGTDKTSKNAAMIMEGDVVKVLSYYNKENRVAYVVTLKDGGKIPLWRSWKEDVHGVTIESAKKNADQVARGLDFKIASEIAMAQYEAAVKEAKAKQLEPPPPPNLKGIDPPELHEVTERPMVCVKRYVYITGAGTSSQYDNYKEDGLYFLGHDWWWGNMIPIHACCADPIGAADNLDTNLGTGGNIPLEQCLVLHPSIHREGEDAQKLINSSATKLAKETIRAGNSTIYASKAMLGLDARDDIKNGSRVVALEDYPNGTFQIDTNDIDKVGIFTQQMVNFQVSLDQTISHGTALNGDNERTQSGESVKALQAVAAENLEPWATGYEYLLFSIAETFLGLVPEVYHTEQVVRMDSPDFEMTNIPINKVETLESGDEVITHPYGIGMYDIEPAIIDDTLSKATEMLQTLQKTAANDEVASKVLLALHLTAMGTPMAREMSKVLIMGIPTHMIPPRIKMLYNMEDVVSPEVQAAQIEQETEKMKQQGEADVRQYNLDMAKIALDEKIADKASQDMKMQKEEAIYKLQLDIEDKKLDILKEQEKIKKIDKEIAKFKADEAESKARQPAHTGGIITTRRTIMSETMEQTTEQLAQEGIDRIERVYDITRAAGGETEESYQAYPGLVSNLYEILKLIKDTKGD